MIQVALGKEAALDSYAELWYDYLRISPKRITLPRMIGNISDWYQLS